MRKANNYAIQAQSAKQRFLAYDQRELIKKYGLPADEDFLYVTMLAQAYRISRKTGDMEKQTAEGWMDGNTYEEVMTLLDLLCDAKAGRHLSGRWKSMQNFGLMFHQNLLEEQRNSSAEFFDKFPEQFHKGCRALGGTPFAGCDMGYGVELFDGLQVAVQFWHGDEEFYPRLRYLWDENALQYIRYETMYFAVSLLIARIRELGQ